jgi:DNA-binding transcriptional MerR regulator
VASADKAPGAFKTIGELSAELGVAQHILRYWETRFPQLKPLQRAGNRRYYRPQDADLARRINRLLNEEGYTVRGVQKLLGVKGGAAAAEEPAGRPPQPIMEQQPAVDVERLLAIRNSLASAIEP